MHDVFAVAALVSPHRKARAGVRARLLRFVEVHVDAPLDVLMSRDPKGHYRRAREGKLRGLTGVDDLDETPERPDVVCVTDRI